MSFRLFALVALALVSVANAACTTNPTTVIIPPPQLVTSTVNTHLTTDLKISFTSSNGQLFSGVSVNFKNPTTLTYSSVCDVSFAPAQLTGSGTTNIGTYGAWATSPTNTGTSCDTAFSGLWSTTTPFHDALNSCFAFDNTTDANYNFFTANVQITTTQDRPAIRGVPVVRTVVAYTRFQFKLQRVVTISSSPTVSGSNLASADVVEILYGEINPSSFTTNVITVYFYTSTPNPYKLTPWTVAGLYGAGMSSMPVNIGANMQGGIPYLFELLSYPAGITGPALSCVNTDPFCNQLWRTQFVYTNVGSSGTCSPSGILRFSYAVNCQSGLSGCVAPGNTNSYDLTTTLSATNLCSQLIQTTTITPSILLYKTDTDASAGTNPSVTFNLGDTIYTVTSMTASNGPNLASATLVSFNLISAITINGITVSSPKGVAGVTAKLYSPSGTTIRAGLSFVADTNALQFTDLNVNQGVTITITWTAVYDIPLSNSKLVLTSSGQMALQDTNSDDLSVTAAFVLSTDSGAASTASASNTMAIAIGAAGGFCVVALIAALIIYHRHVKKMMAQREQSSKVQIFVPMTSSSNLAAPEASVPAPEAATQA